MTRDPGTLVEEAAAEFQAGRPDAAAQRLDGLWNLPGTTSAHWRRAGAVFMAGGHPGRAEAALRRAVELDPGDARVRFELARVLRAVGKGQEAVDHLETGCRIAPGAPDGAHLMGVMHLEQGLVDGAVAWLSRARSAGGDSADLFTDLGLALKSAGDLDAAEAAYRRALARDPGHTGALRGLARIARLRRRPEDGLALLEPRIATSEDGGLLAETADLMSAVGRSAEAIELLETRLHRIARDEGRMEAHFRLGQLLDAAGRYAGAMEHFAAGNRLKGADFDPGHYAGLVDRLLEAFDRASMARMPKAGHGDRRPVFIVGMPRSGTSLVEQIIASHPRAVGAGEIADIGMLALATRSGGLEYPESVRALTPADVDSLADAYRRRLDAIGPGARRVTDKMWQNFEFLGFAELLFPEARVVHCTRDPLDTGLSCFSQHFHASGVSFSYDLAHIGAYYLQYRRIMDHWKSVLNLPILDVSYEDLVEDVEGGTRTLLEFVGLPWDDVCLRFFDNERVVRTASHDQVRRPVYRSSVGRHRHYEEWLGPLRDALGKEG
jgi:tetratricopeptide (TPR) repeat protein